MMTPKERREAQIELRDMATTLENRFVEDSHYPDTKRLERARLLRAVAAELDRFHGETIARKRSSAAYDSRASASLFQVRGSRSA